MTQTTTVTSTSARHPALGMIAIIAGVLGLLLSLAGIGAAVAGRNWVGDRLDDLATSASAALDTALAVSDQAVTAIQDGVTVATSLQSDAASLAANPALD